MLPGYVHKPSRFNLDSRTGVIAQQGGLSIAYDIGTAAGDYTTCKLCDWTKDEIWRREQVVQGHKVVVVFTNTKRLIVSYPEEHANFYATITSPEQMTDMLLMVLTYTPGS